MNMEFLPPRDEGDRVIVARRVFAAPPELVFGLWSDPTHLEHWYGPRGFATATECFEFRPGGLWRHTMTGPDGRAYPNEARFVAIEAPRRIVYDHAEPAFRTTVTFRAHDSGTEVTVSMLFPTAAARQRTQRDFGAEEGLGQTLDRLGDMLAGAVAEVRFERRFPVSRATMFRMWTEADHLARWWGPVGFTNPVCQFEPRPGGAIYIVMQAPDGAQYPMGGEVLVCEPPQRLVFLARALDPGGRILLEAHTDVTFIEDADGCLVRLHARGVARDPLALAMLKGMREGWSTSLDRLDAHAGAARERVLVLQRRFAAPPDAVFRAWRDPEQARRWMGPRGFTARHFEPATEPGEPWRACLVEEATGKEMWQGGVLLAAEEPTRLVLTASWERDDGSRSPETRVTVEFAPDGSGTMMRFRQEGFASVPARDGHAGGWNSAFDCLDDFLSGAMP